MPIVGSRCIAVIPCLNEERTISSVVAGVLRHLPAALVVNDGSTDRTSDRAKNAGAIVVERSENGGKGIALTEGLQRAQALGFHWALALDGDGQHSPDDIAQFLTRTDETGAAMVIGDRMRHPDRMPWIRYRVNLWMSTRLSAYCGCALPDSQCGFRLLELERWSRFQFKAQ